MTSEENDGLTTELTVTEPEPKRIRIQDEGQPQLQEPVTPQQPQTPSNLRLPENFLVETHITDLLERLRNSAYRMPPMLDSDPHSTVCSPTTTQYLPEDDVIESLRMQNLQLRRDNDKKDAMVQDLLKKLHDAIDAIKLQTHQIKELQTRCSSDKDEENVFKVPAPIVRMPMEPSMLELRILTQPPSQAIYQRILRPFPTVAIGGVSHMRGAQNSLFVEVTLLVQDDQLNPLYPNTYGKLGNNVELEKRNLLIGGQLVQRSESGASSDTLIVVFRKLKILTTTAQQGGSFFLLKFTLKRYVDNQFEPMPNVLPVVSDPIEVFSHTLYLKGRPLQPRQPKISPEQIQAQLNSTTPTIPSSTKTDASVTPSGETAVPVLVQALPED